MVRNTRKGALHPLPSLSRYNCTHYTGGANGPLWSLWNSSNHLFSRKIFAMNFLSITFASSEELESTRAASEVEFSFLKHIYSPSLFYTSFWHTVSINEISFTVQHLAVLVFLWKIRVTCLKPCIFAQFVWPWKISIIMWMEKQVCKTRQILLPNSYKTSEITQKNDTQTSLDVIFNEKGLLTNIFVLL